MLKVSRLDGRRTIRMSSAHEQRRTLVVNHPLQRRIVKDIGLLPLTVLVVGTLVLGVLLRDLEREAHEHALALRSATPLLCGLVGFVLTCSFVMLTQALRISNRVAGPQVRVRQVVDDVLAGNTAMRVHIRGNDYLHETAADINRLILHIDTLRRDQRDSTDEAGAKSVGAAEHEHV